MSKSRIDDRATPSTESARWSFWAVLATGLAFVAVIGFGAFAYQSFAAEAREDTRALLLSTARARSREIAQHVAERKADAMLLAADDETRRFASGQRAPATAAALRKATLAQMRAAASAYDYHNLVLFDASFRQLIGLAHDEFSPETQAALRATTMTRRPQFVPLHLSFEGVPEYGAVAPIFATSEADAPVVGAVYIALRAETWLYPTLASAGMLGVPFVIALSQVNGDTVIVATSTRMSANVPPLSQRYPMESPDSARAITGALLRPQITYERGTDFRGEPVEIAAASVAGTPWAVSAKIPLAESESAIRLVRDALIVIGFLLFGLLYSIVAILQRRARAATAMAERESAERALRVVETSMDGVVVLSDDGRFLEANDVALAMTGYTPAEFGALTLADIKVVDGDGSEIFATIERIKSGAVRRYLSRWRRKDGTIMDVDVSASFLQTERGGHIYAFIRDVTDVLQRRRSLERLNRLYQFVNHASEGSFAATSAEEAYERICRAAVADAGFRIAWVGTVDAAQGVVRPARCSGAPPRTFETVRVSTAPDLPTSQGAVVRAIQERRVIFSAHLELDPVIALLRKGSTDFTIRSEVACPVVVEGEVSAVIVLYSDDTDPLDAEAITLVGEVGRMLGLVVQSLRAAERLAGSEERFRRIFDLAALPQYVIEERSGRITRVNKSLTALLGYELADVPHNDTLMARFYPDPTYRAMLVESITRQLGEVTSESPIIRSPDLTVRSKDGREFYIQAFITRAGGEIIVSAVDLTELRTSQLLLGEAQHMARIGSWDIDQRTGGVHFSPELYRILELDATTPASPETYLDRVVPVELGTLQHVFERLRVEQEPVVLEHRLQFPGDRTKTVVLRAITHFGDDGTPLRSVGSVQDVTAQADTRRELERYRDHLEDLVAARTDALAKANATLQATDRRLKAMLVMSQRASALNEREIYQLGIDEAVRLTGSDSGYIHLISNEQEQVEFGLWSSGTGAQRKAAFESLFGTGMGGASSDSVQIHNDGAEAAVLRGHPTGSSALCRHMSVPVLEGDKVRLLLGVGNKPGDYDQFDVQELQLIGHDIWTIVSRRRAELALEQAYEAVRASEERFAFAMDAASEGIWDWDFETGRIDASAACFTMLGRRAGEFQLTQPKLIELMHPDDRVRVEREGATQLAALGGFALEYRLRAKDGSWRWILSHAKVTARDEHGAPTRAVGTHTDLTARKSAEEELRTAKEQADAASRAKSAFLAVMSHEIRTPLNGVLGMAEVLAQSTLPPKEADAVRTIRTSANNLLGLIDDILDFSKIEAGRLDLEFTDTSIPEILEDVCSGLASVAARRQVELSFFLAPTVPHRIHSDAMRLRQILYNVVGNAVKFSGGQSARAGRVTIRVDIARSEPFALRLTVQDNGIGMSPETLGRLFNSFMQAEASTTRRFGGTGLGLAICKRLTELFGGTIEVASTLGEGSIFTITIPLTPAAEQPVRHLPDVGGLQCVFVRDPRDPQDVQDANDCAAYLVHAGATVSFAPDPRTAIGIAETLPRPVVVVDCAPIGNGISDPVPPVDDIRHLHVTHGQRRSARILTPTSVTLDRQYVREESFLRAVAVAAGRVSPEILQVIPETPLIETATWSRSIAEAREHGRLILVAEDDEINQKVILRQLDLLGYAGEVALNGKEALAMWRRGGYALLLTDLHMPEMDGYALTTAIRAEERGSGHFPIIALTANALRGESSHARTAGMDDFLTKPIPLRTLKDSLRRWISVGAGATEPDIDESAPVLATTALDLSILHALVGNDPAVVRGFLEEYDAMAQRLAGEIQEAFAQDDLARVSSLAHRLKSSSRSVGATALGDRCAEIETSAKRVDGAGVRASIDVFDHELQRVQRELARVLHLSDLDVPPSSDERP